MVETVFRDDQVSQLSRHLGLSKVSVTKILVSYVNYLKEKIESGCTVKFLNVCYLKVGGQEEPTHETLAYISNELGRQLGYSQTVVNRVLSTYEEFLIRDLRKLYSYNVRGLLKIRLEKYNGNYRVRTKKSTVYNGMDLYITTLGGFKRRVEVVDT